MKSFMKWACIPALPLVVALCGGCPQAGPGEEGILAGVWVVTLDADADGEQTILEFDAFGNIVRFGTVNGNTTISSDNVSGTTTVSGSAVTIKMTSNNFKFVGTFNANFSVANGRKYTEFEIFGTTTTIDEGPATMVRAP